MDYNVSFLPSFLMLLLLAVAPNCLGMKRTLPREFTNREGPSSKTPIIDPFVTVLGGQKGSGAENIYSNSIPSYSNIVERFPNIQNHRQLSQQALNFRRQAASSSTNYRPNVTETIPGIELARNYSYLSPEIAPIVQYAVQNNKKLPIPADPKALPYELKFKNVKSTIFGPKAEIGYEKRRRAAASSSSSFPSSSSSYFSSSSASNLDFTKFFYAPQRPDTAFGHFTNPSSLQLPNHRQNSLQGFTTANISQQTRNAHNEQQKIEVNPTFFVQPSAQVGPSSRIHAEPSIRVDTTFFATQNFSGEQNLSNANIRHQKTRNTHTTS